MSKTISNNSEPSASPFPAPQSSLPEKMENLKEWSIRTLKCTKQSLEEKFGLSKPSIDPKIQGKIDELRNTQKLYSDLISEIDKSFQYFELLTESQNNISSMMNMLCVNQRELSAQFNLLAYQHQEAAKNFKQYTKDLADFRESLKTVTFKAIQDTLLTVDKKFTTARLEYDYLLNEIRNEMTKNRKNLDQKGEIQTSPQTHEKLDQLKSNYEQLKDDVDVKISLVNENRIRVLNANLSSLMLSNRRLFCVEGTSLAGDYVVNLNVNLKPVSQSFLEVA